MERTRKKRIIIIFVYLVLFFLLVVGIYFLFKSEETCFDGIKNQNEQEIDCGGICQKKCDTIEARDLIVGKIGTTPSGLAGKYDFYAEIDNPNVIFGSRKFEYEIKLKDSSGSVIASRNNASFILPSEKKYVTENNIESSGVPTSLEFKIINSEWVEFKEYYERPNLQIVNKNFASISSGVGFFEATGLLKNESLFDFDTIKIQILLKDNQDNILALNSTQIKTVKAGEIRDFRVFWPSSFSGSVGKIEAQAEVNIFDSSVFLKRFYKTEKFQQY